MFMLVNARCAHQARPPLRSQLRYEGSNRGRATDGTCSCGLRP